MPIGAIKMVSVYDSMIAIRDYLRTNVSDPISRSGQWIHYDVPSVNAIGKTPTVFIERAPGSRMRDYAGGNQDQFIRVHIHIFVTRGDTGKVGATTVDRTVSNSVNKLIDLIEQAISNSIGDGTTISTTYVKYMQKVDAGGVVAVNDNLLDNMMVYMVELV